MFKLYCTKCTRATDFCIETLSVCVCEAGRVSESETENDWCLITLTFPRRCFTSLFFYLFSFFYSVNLSQVRQNDVKHQQRCHLITQVGGRHLDALLLLIHITSMGL